MSEPESRGRSEQGGEEGLERKLGPFQLTMIAMGSAIGVGLFLGSGATIGLAGPAVVLTYVLAALIATIVGFALAEMATVHPLAGSFGIYAERYLNPWAGFVLRLTYWFAEALAIGAEVTAVGLYCAYWFPRAPAWVFMLASALLALAVNAANVSIFGWLESWFALIKLSAIVLFIVVGGGLILGLGKEKLGLVNLLGHGGFAPHGMPGIWLALTLVITSYIGVEVIAVTAGEAEHPERSVPRAMFGMVAGLSLVYFLAIFVVVATIPWTEVAETGGTLTGSPFVKVFTRAGIPYAAGIMNFVVTTAAASGVVTNLYLCTRMLFSLSRSGYVPSGLGRLDRRGVPLPALFASTAGMVVAIVLALKGQAAFLPLFGTAVAAMLFIWIAVLVTHLRFRRRLAAERIADLPLKVPFFPFSILAAIGLLLAILASTPLVAGLRWTVPFFLIWLGIVSLVYAVRRRK